MALPSFLRGAYGGKTPPKGKNMSGKLLRHSAALLAAAALFLTGCDNSEQEEAPADEVQQEEQNENDGEEFDDNNGIDTDQGDDSRGEENEDGDD